MKLPLDFTRLINLTAAAIACTGVLLLTGCANMVTTAAVEDSPAGSIKGNIHGGQFPVSGAAVTLYEASYTGYGGTAGVVTSFKVTSGGSGYSVAPTVTISGGGGSGATATATITSGAVTSVNLTSRGSGYTTAPTVTLSAPGGSGTTATATAAISADGALALATTSTDTNGNFQFTQSSGVALPNGSLSSTYHCDSLNPTALIYIIATGGNTQGTGSTTNSAATFLAAVGDCNNISTSTTIVLNELSTAATTYALAQYINPGSTAGTETVGTSSSAQGRIGLNNAFASIANLAAYNGALTTITPPTYAGTGTAAGVTVTATAEAAKLVTVANILAACINTTTSSSTQCADLFANATAPTASTTSQPGATFPTAVDTLQAAYYLATNPALNGAFTSCSTNTSQTTKAGCLFALITAAAPFQTGLTTAPSDFTIGVTYTASGTCVNGSSLIAGPNKIDVDANGNLWFINATPTLASLVQITPQGQPLQCVGAQASAGRGITIDPTGNVWGAFNAATANLATSIIEVPLGTGTPVYWAAPFAPIAMASDGSGNVFFSTANAGGGFYEIPNPGTNTTPSTPTLIATGFNGTASTQIGYIAADPTGRIYGVSSTVGDLVVAVPPASGTTYTQAAPALTENSYGIAIDSNNYLYTGATCCGSSPGTGYRDITKITPGTGTAITFTNSTQYTAGVNGTRGAVVDGAANVWYGYELPNIAPVTGPPAVPAYYTIGEVATSGSGTTATFTSLSPNGVPPSACSTSACYTTGGFLDADFTIVPDLAVDLSGNVWALNGGTNNTTVPTNGTSITELVGAGVPVVAPLSISAKNNTLGTKP